MSVVLKFNPGFDASYPWRQIGTAATDGGRGRVPDPLEYYLAPAEKGGEPPGTWAGRGLAALGLEAGAVIDRGVFEKLFGDHLDPRDPTGTTRLGRAPQRFKSEQDIYAELAEAEPHATGARLAELRAQARASVRHAVPFWDATVSFSKSVTLFYGGLLAAAERARRAGDLAAAGEWEAKAARAMEGVRRANQKGLDFLQEQAGMTRTGYHRGTSAESRAELGKWEHARNWITGVFPQHTSRSGDPQLHIHNLILNKVQTERDGKWRKHDSRFLYRWERAAAAVVAAELEKDWSEAFGVYWVPRADGHGREIAGFTQHLMDTFSTRRETITEQARQVAAEREQETGRRPDARQMSRIQKDIAYRTRAHKPEEPLDLRAKLAEWDATAREHDLGELADIPAAVIEAAQRERARDQALAGQARALMARVAQVIGAEHVRRYGRAPGAAEAADMERWASFLTMGGARVPEADPAQLFDGWHAARRADTETEQNIRREAARAEARLNAERTTPAAAAQAQAQVDGQGYPAQVPTLTEQQERYVMAEAVVITQARIPAWTKASLMGYLQDAMPRGVLPDGATLARLADAAVRGESGEPVVLLSAPQWPVPPPSLRCADHGLTMFVPEATERYATKAQLSLEEQLLTQAQEPAAPRLDPETVAQLLGADRAGLETQLEPEPTTAAALSQVTGSGLRMDQAAAAYHVLTSARRAEVMVGPAGTGKTHTTVEMARIWTDTGTGPVAALTTSSNARNVLRDEATRYGVALTAWNTAEWLGHTEDRREARQPVDLAAGTLLILDEASMMSLPDLAAVIRRAAANGAKVVVTGDPMQFQAIDGGGGMDMLARHLGHVQLSEAGRFTHHWEREATLRLRDGDTTVLADYRQHDRLHAGRAENMLDQAARAYLHDRLNGKDTLLMCGTDAMAAELSRRVRDDLIRWGIVDPGPYVTVRNGYRASRGDLIMARKNVNGVRAGEKDRELANRDVLRITNTDPDSTGSHVQVERMSGRDRAGHEQWSAPFSLDRSYLWKNVQLAYAVTFHAAEGHTVDAGHAVLTGQENRQAVNVALTRGREDNQAYVIAGWKLADPKPGPEADPELARHDMLARERAGLSPGPDSPTPDTGAMTAEAVIGMCLENDGRQLSATDTREADWSDMDRLDILGIQWDELARQAAQRRYETALREALPGGQADAVMDDEAATWLWRSLREAEAAGLDGPATLHRAISARSLDGARSLAKVIDSRIRQQTAGMPALAARPFAEQIEPTGDPDTDRYWSELAHAMDDRQRRLGEHAAEHPPPWAAVLGPVPEHPVDRADWEHKAGKVAAYGEMWGPTSPREPIGARPSRHADPQQHRMWQAAAEALGRQPGAMTEHSDGQLHAWRNAFAREMEWAPPYYGDDLAIAREAIRRAQIDTDRARRNAHAANSEADRQRLEHLARVQATWEQQARDVAAKLTEAQAGYDAWETATAPTRDRAVAADAELRRRHPDTRLEPLRGHTPTASPPEPATLVSPAKSPEPMPVSLRAELAEMGWFGPTESPPPAIEPARPGTAGTAPAAPAAPAVPEPDTTPAAHTGPACPDLSQQLREISAKLDDLAMHQAHQAQEKAAEITSMTIPAAEDPDTTPGPAWVDDLQARQREAVRHEPMPRVPHSPALETVAETGEPGPEAAD